MVADPNTYLIMTPGMVGKLLSADKNVSRTPTGSMFREDNVRTELNQVTTGSHSRQGTDQKGFQPRRNFKSSKQPNDGSRVMKKRRNRLRGKKNKAAVASNPNNTPVSKLATSPDH